MGATVIVIHSPKEQNIGSLEELAEKLKDPGKLRCQREHSINPIMPRVQSKVLGIVLKLKVPGRLKYRLEHFLTLMLLVAYLANTKKNSKT